ncbi:hypothetical protein FQ085_06485 [Planococcus sp. ANT_H30]|uniref:hypothetical protein n=1 Tax=Planococcus sp. ANT_H30 TaxID=2597347 RepID=UPI0011F0348A|nr:hypothetical protein [Planococcus sp. ANT_H30]KAA0957693.1 hypothetical protein FQ085_06485 [Planococcus sp. ANT_H30]
MKIVQIKMDKERNLKFGMNAVVKLEKDLGMSIAEMQDEMSMENLMKITFYGLKWEDKKLNFDDIGDLMDAAIEHYETFAAVIELVMEAFTATFGKKAVPSKK